MALTHQVLADLNGTGTLVDISADVIFDDGQGIVRTWGRTDWLADVPNVGTLTFSLDNGIRGGNGAYTPGNPTNIYQTGVAEGVWVWWRVYDPSSLNGTVRGGYAGQFTMQAPTISFPNGRSGSCVVTVQCVDILGLFQGRICKSLYDEEMTSSGSPQASTGVSLVGYWPMTDGNVGGSCADHSGLNQPPLVMAPGSTTIKFQGANGLKTEGASAVMSTVSPTQLNTSMGTGWLSTSGQGNLNCPAPSSGTKSWTIAAWVSIPPTITSAQAWNGTTGISRYVNLLEVTDTSGYTQSFGWDRVLQLPYMVVNYGGYSGYVNQFNSHATGYPWKYSTDGTSIDDCQLITFTLGVSGGNIWAQCTVGSDNQGGYASMSLTAPSGMTNWPQSISVGSCPRGNSQGAGGPGTSDWVGAIHHVSLYIGSSDATGLYQYLQPNGVGFTEDATSRLTRVTKWVAAGHISPYLYGAEHSDQLEVQDTAGKSALQVVCDALRLEGGYLAAYANFVSSAPATVPFPWPLRADVGPPEMTWQNTTSYALLLDVEADLSVIPDLVRDLSGRVQTVTASGRYNSGVAYYGSDPTASGATATLNAATSNGVRLGNLAQLRVAQGRTNTLQLTGFTVDTRTSSSYVGGSGLIAGLSDSPQRFRITGLPAALMGITYADYFVIGATETYSLDEASVAYVCKPADTPAPAFFTPASLPTSDYSQNSWRFDVGSDFHISQSMAAANSSNLNCYQTDPVNQPTWSTTAGDYPLDVMVGNECMTVSAPPTDYGDGHTKFWTPSQITRGARGTNARAHSPNELVTLYTQPTFVL